MEEITRIHDKFFKQVFTDKENLFFTALVMMKHAYHRKQDELRRMFRLWLEKEFFRNPNMMEFALIYLAQTGETDRETLEKMMNENKLDGGAVMESLYEKIENVGIVKGRQETARNAFEKGLSEDLIADLTGFSMDEIKKIKNAWLSSKVSKTTH